MNGGVDAAAHEEGPRRPFEEKGVRQHSISKGILRKETAREMNGEEHLLFATYPCSKGGRSQDISQVFTLLSFDVNSVLLEEEFVATFRFETPKPSGV